MNNDVYRTLIEKTNQPTSIIQVIFNEIGDPVDYITLYMNPAAETQLGLKREETIGRRAKEISPNAEQEWFARYGEVVKTGISASFERHSSTFNIYFNIQLIPLGNDQVGILFQDITEVRVEEEAKKNAIEALRTSEAKYRTIFETSQECIWVIDGNDKTILVNERLQHMLGYSFDELVGKSPKEFMAPEFKAEANERLAKHMGGMKQVIDYRFVKKDGSYLWCILSATPLFDKDGKFDGSIAMFTDITERKLAEEALKKSERKAIELVEELTKAKEELIKALHLAEQKSAEWNAVVDAVPDGLSVYGKNGDILYMNDTVNNIIGNYDYSGKSSLEERMEDLKSTRLNGDKIDIKETTLYVALNSGKTTRDSQAMTKINGEIIYSSHSGAPIRNSIGGITGAVIIHKDITERVELEKKTDRLVEELHRADKNKNAFINMLSHELRNPLATIMMSLQLLEKASPGGKQAEMALSIAKRQGKQLTNLVDGLLDITRITQNKIALKKETIEINDLINMAIQDNKSQFIDKDVKLEVKLTLPLYIEADSSRLTQVIGNLLHNAAKFTKKDDLVMVSVTEDTNASEVIIIIQDTGRGMDPKDQLNLFEPFMQVDQSLDRKLGGLGLGLSIVKAMVELHGGRVEAFSEGIGKGTKFTIKLPL